MAASFEIELENGSRLSVTNVSHAGISTQTVTKTYPNDCVCNDYRVVSTWYAQMSKMDHESVELKVRGICKTRNTE